jgi:hypothetical protein
MNIILERIDNEIIRINVGDIKIISIVKKIEGKGKLCIYKWNIKQSAFISVVANMDRREEILEIE